MHVRRSTSVKRCVESLNSRICDTRTNFELVSSGQDLTEKHKTSTVLAPSFLPSPEYHSKPLFPVCQHVTQQLVKTYKPFDFILYL